MFTKFSIQNFSFTSRADFSLFVIFLRNFSLTKKPCKPSFGLTKNETPSICAATKLFWIRFLDLFLKSSCYSLNNDRFLRSNSHIFKGILGTVTYRMIYFISCYFFLKIVLLCRKLGGGGGFAGPDGSSNKQILELTLHLIRKTGRID